MPEEELSDMEENEYTQLKEDRLRYAEGVARFRAIKARRKADRDLAQQ